MLQFLSIANLHIGGGHAGYGTPVDDPLSGHTDSKTGGVPDSK